MPKRLDPALFARAIMLESAEIPADMTIAEWRRARQVRGVHARAAPAGAAAGGRCACSRLS